MEKLKTGPAAMLLDRLGASGYEAFVVGGFVREALREEGDAKATDMDVATDATPSEVMEVFSDLRVIETGIKHGTLTVMIPAGQGEGGEIPVEVTTYRSDGEYRDARHPEKVRFVSSIEEDLSRRDFTMNAMAMASDGRVIDPFGGMKDLAAGILRAVGGPEKRFSEDALRIMRGLRFASVMKLEIEDKTGEAMLSRRNLLKKIAAERIFTELKKTLTGAWAGDILRRYTDIFIEIIPELEPMRGFDQRNPYHRYDVLEHCIRALEEVKTTGENVEYMKMAALLHDVGKPDTFSLDEDGIGHFYGHPAVGAEIGKRIMRRLKADNFTTDRVAGLIAHHDLMFEEDKGLLKRWMRRYGRDVLVEILDIKRADNIATGNVGEELLEKYDRIERMIGEIIEDEECFKLSDLAVTGNDLINAGIPEGPERGRALEVLLGKVIDGELKNDRRSLLDELARISSGL